VEHSRQQSQKLQEDMQAKIKEVKSSLDGLYGAIGKNNPPAHQDTPIPKKQAEKPVYSAPNTAKNFLKDLPPQTQETLAAAGAAEEKRRRKFMEDVEAWAQATNKDNQS
jgi:hypothetical protein